MVITSTDVKLPALLKTLESATIGTDEKVEVYKIFSDQIQEDELSFFDLDITYYLIPVVTVLHRDILHSAESVQQGALQVLGFCLHDLEIVRLIPIENQKSLLTSICKCLKNSEDKSTSTRGLWVISKQNIQPDLVVYELDNIMSTISHCLSKWRGQAQTVEYEVINVIARLNEQVSKDMNNKTQWEKICLGLLTHPATRVREKALKTLEDGCEIGAYKNLMKEVIVEYKSKTAGELKRLFPGNEHFVLKAWCFLVKYFGEELHHGGFINILLSIAEMGFKSLDPEIKISAFYAWRELINNFSHNISIVSDPKRVKLLMQVFKANNAKVESVALVKYDTWTHFIRKLGTKISVNFEQVLVPLLQFCAGGSKLTTSATSVSTPTTPRFGMKNPPTSPITPRLSITSTPSQLPTFKTLQLKGVEILARVLGEQSHHISSDPFGVDIITSPMFFVKQSTVLISCFRELVMCLGNGIPENVLTCTWKALIGHVHVAVDLTPRSDHREMFSYFLHQFQLICLTDNLGSNLLTMFQSVCELPLKVLSSNVYNIGGGEVMGTPSLFLCEILLSPVLIQSSIEEESYMTMYGKLVNCGMMNTTGTLEFSHGVLDIIDRHVQFLPNIELLWRLWSVIANRLLEHIIKTSEINQGDSLEYDFTCLYASLILPVKHKIGAQVSQPVCKSLMKTWSDLYKCFARQSALVTTADDNVVCEDFCSRIINNLTDAELKECGMIDFLVQILLDVVHSLDFSSLSGNTVFTGNFSPSKRWLKHKQKPLENLHSFIHLLSDLLSHSMDISENNGFLCKPKTTPSVNVAINGLVDIVTTLVTHISSSNIISNMFNKIAEPLSRLFHTTSVKNGSKLYTPAFYQKLEKLWLDISTCLQSRYTSIYDSDFLQKLSPLLEATFTHPRRSIKNQTIVLWNSTFSKSSMLTYPDKLKTVLVKVKEKTPLSLPGWVTMETTIIDETPASQSQFSQMDAPEPHLPGLPSPHKFRGSFLNKVVSPNIKKSPAKAPVVETRNVGSVKKKLAIDGLTNNDYVVIKASKHSRILTEHQKEALKEKRSIPAMYNNLDQSQSLDISMMTQFNSQTQSDSVTEVLPSQNDVVVISSSQSQSSQSMVVSEPGSTDGTLKKTDMLDSSIEFKEPTRGRRRSSRFSWEEEKKIDSSQEKSSNSQENVEVIDSSKISDSSSSLKQNVEGAIGFISQPFESISNIESSSSDSKMEDKQTNSQDSSQSSLRDSHQTGFTGNRSFSQSPKRTPRTSPKHKANSQETRSISQSPKRKSEIEKSSFNLDHWVLRSPPKTKSLIASLSSQDLQEENPVESNILSETLVEDTQSPTKFKKSPPVMSNKSPITTPPNRNLFTVPKHGSVSESPEAVPESPETLPDVVLKIHKLTNNDIKKYSQENVESSLDNRSNSMDLETQFSINKVAANIQCSQGFQTISGQLTHSDSFGFLSKDTSVDLNGLTPADSARGISGLLTAEQKDQLDNSTTQESFFSAVTQSQSLSNSQSIVSDEQEIRESQMSMTYDPTTVNTLRDTRSQDISTGSFDNQSDASLTQKSDSCASEDSYDPTKMSTFQEESPKKKRKQITPKKSPINLTPRRTPRRHKKRRHSDCACCPDKEEHQQADIKSLESISEEEIDKSMLKSTNGSSAIVSENTPVNLVSGSLANEFTEDLISEQLDSLIEATEQTPEGKKPCKEIKRKSTTKEKMAVAKRRSAKLAEDGTKSRKQLEEKSDNLKFIPKSKNKPSKNMDVANLETNSGELKVSTISEKTVISTRTRRGTKDIETVKNTEPPQELSVELHEPLIKCCKDESHGESDVKDFKLMESQNSLESSIAEVKELSTHCARKGKNYESQNLQKQSVIKELTQDSVTAADTKETLTRSARKIRHAKEVADDSESQQSSQSSQSSTRSRKHSKLSSPKTHRLRSSGLVLQTRTLRDGKKITLAKLSPVVKRMRRAGRKVRSVSESDADVIQKNLSDVESQKSELHDNAEISAQSDNAVLPDSAIGNDVGDAINSKIDVVEKPVSNDTQTNNIFGILSNEQLERKDVNSKDSNELPVIRNKSDIPLEESVLDAISKESEKLLELKPEQEHNLEKEKTSSPQIIQEETPKKFKFAKKCSISGLMNSDSKVIGLNRLGSRALTSVRGFNIVRRSILQQRNQSDDQTKQSVFLSGSPKRSNKIRSPVASPSTGILKRRFNTTDLHANSPSPPSKHRRVSFAMPIVASQSPVKYQEINAKPPSPLVTNSFTQLTCSGSKFVVGSPSLTKNKKNEKELEDSETSQSQTFKCTDESELSAVGPAFPDFVDCDEPVDKILKHLTSSVWSRGLVQLIRSSVRNINTVGEFCRLSEYEINNLPIRNPKLTTVCKALTTFFVQYKKNNNTSASATEKEDKFTLPTVMEDEEVELPSADDALEKLAGDTTQHNIEDSEDLLKLSQSSDSDQLIKSLQSDTESSNQSNRNKIDISAVDSANLLDIFNSVNQSGMLDNLSDMRTGDLFKLHQNLTTFTNKVVAAIQTKCHTNSQDV